MKQLYIRPEVVALHLSCCNILAGSDGTTNKDMDIHTGSDKEITDESMFLSREYDDIWDDDDEY